MEDPTRKMLTGALDDAISSWELPPIWADAIEQSRIICQRNIAIELRSVIETHDIAVSITTETGVQVWTFTPRTEPV